MSEKYFIDSWDFYLYRNAWEFLSDEGKKDFEKLFEKVFGAPAFEVFKEKFISS